MADLSPNLLLNNLKEEPSFFSEAGGTPVPLLE